MSIGIGMTAAVRSVPPSPRDRLLASAVLAVYERLAAGTCACYVPAADHRRTLGVAVAVDSPGAFIIPSELDADDLRLPTVRAFRTREPVFATAAEMRAITRLIPAHFLHNPFPVMVAAVPVVTPEHDFGCLSVRWPVSRRGETGFPAEAPQYLREVADGLAEGLSRLAGQGVPMTAPPVPLFVAPAAGGADAGAPADAGPAAPGQGAVSATFLYRVKQLSSELASTATVRDVLDVARSQVMLPFGAGALMLCRVGDGRLHVVGSTGFSRDQVGRVEGTSLSRSTPETDAVTEVKAVLLRPGDAAAGPAAPAGPSSGAEQWPRAFVPLVANGRATGCCVLGFPAGHPFDPADEEVALAALMLGQIGQALERVHAREAEHAFAMTMQESLLPPVLPLRPEAALTSRYLPATEGASVGGDWYDVVPLPDGGMGLVVGDVEGHSAQAAGVMGHLRSAVLAYATEGHEPASILERTDRLLRGLGASRYATCCCFWLDPATGLARVATAGHPLPLVSPAPGVLAPLDVPVGLPLGIGGVRTYEQRELTLGPGSLVALFTDGLLDTRALGPDTALERLADGVVHGDRRNLDTLADALVGDRHRRSHHTLDDDLALLLMRYDGGPAGDRRDVARLSVQRHDLQAVGSVRRFLRDLARRWDAEPALDDLRLAVSELVTNALVHAQSDIDVRVRRHADRVRVEVQDSSARPPVPAVIVADETVNARAESGRGLLIVDALAEAWGSSPAGRGKTTWLEMRLPLPDGAPEPPGD